MEFAGRKTWTGSPKGERMGIRESISASMMSVLPRLDVGAVSPYRNYLSTMLLRPFKDLECHKGKKHRHHRLSLLLRGLLATSQLRSSA